MKKKTNSQIKIKNLEPMVIATIIRLPGANKTREAMDEEGERASWLLLSAPLCVASYAL
jgi:hypothetical protein